MSEVKRGRGLLANRQREKEEHLKEAFDAQPIPVKKRRDEGFKAGRLSMDAYNAIRDIYYEQKLGSFAEAADIVVNFYLEHHKEQK